jgi:hypothetical protein
MPKRGTRGSHLKTVFANDCVGLTFLFTCRRCYSEPNKTFLQTAPQLDIVCLCLRVCSDLQSVGTRRYIHSICIGTIASLDDLSKSNRVIYKRKPAVGNWQFQYNRFTHTHTQPREKRSPDKSKLHAHTYTHTHTHTHIYTHTVVFRMPTSSPTFYGRSILLSIVLDFSDYCIVSHCPAGLHVRLWKGVLPTTVFPLPTSLPITHSLSLLSSLLSLFVFLWCR